MDSWQLPHVAHLFLLVGTNPLPNYVAARLLARSQTILYLVHTRETAPVADRLIQVLDLGDDWWKKIETDGADAHKIFQDISAYARGKTGLALNYTGGTKVMAVHAYRAVREADPAAVCSYLDAGTLSLLVDQQGARSHSHPVALAVPVDIQTLLQLHGYAVNEEALGTQPFHPDVCRAFLDVSQAEMHRWCREELHEDPHRSSGKAAEREGTRRPLKKPAELELLPLPSWFPFAAASGCRTLGGLARQWDVTVLYLARWLDGLWLEDYTLHAVYEAALTGQIHCHARGVKPRQISVGTPDTLALSRSFEIDVMAMRGYQLFAISCTTMDRKGEVKGKLFEAYVRARQMGGEEARVGVVCFASPHDRDSSPARIQAELEESWDARGKLRVFGVQDLPNLGERLKEWFCSQP